jgi:two-component system chemotaxis sensor kinase CheA
VDQTQREFLVEIEELIELVFADLAELRTCISSGRESREVRNLVDQTFRHVHSVKGSAASSGLEAVSQIAHEFENLLDAIRSGRTLIGPDALDACDLATEALSESLSHSAANTPAPSLEALFNQLRMAAQGSARDVAGDAEAILSSIPSDIWQSLTQAEKHRAVSVAEETTPMFIVTTSFDLSNFDEQFFSLKEKLGEFGEVISTSPTVDDKHPGKINFRVLYASKTDAAKLAASVLQFSDIVFNALPGSATRVASKDGESQPLASVSSMANFVRTDLAKLDELISSTHELLRTTSNALHLALGQDEIIPDARVQLQELESQIKKSFMTVENGLINLRMVSLGPTLQRVLRAGRASAREAGKEIDFEIAGENIALDKLLVDAIADPLIHLIRNAVDHGIEDVETRLETGKPLRGRVRIEARSDGSQSRISVADDGRGIDPQVIAAAAERLGLLESDSLDFERSLRLIFRPGFTTLESVSNVSGRGVGLDVVETTVEQVGGELRVSSKPGLGTTFEVRLPVTFGLLEATVFVSGGNRYCIPANQAVSARTIGPVPVQPEAAREQEPKQIENDNTQDLTRVSMRTLLGTKSKRSLEEGETEQETQLITCQFADETNETPARVEVLVDAVEGTEEVLVRTLGRHAGRWYGVAGAAELRDGTVALVLDLPRLLSGKG